MAATATNRRFAAAPQDVASLAANVHALWPWQTGAMAMVEWNGDKPEHCVVTVEMLDRSGKAAGPTAVYPLIGGYGGKGARPVARMFQGAGALYAVYDGAVRHVRAARENLDPLARELAGAGQGPIEVIATDGTAVAALQCEYPCDGAQSVIAFDIADKQPRSRRYDLSPLDLGGVRRVTNLVLSGQDLLVAVCDPVAGYEIWRFDRSVAARAGMALIRRGADRFAINAAISALGVSKHGILAGTAGLASLPGQTANWGPELGLIRAGANWDLIFGQPRPGRNGPILPSSTRGAGLDLPDNAAIKVIVSHSRSDRERVFVVMQEYAGAMVARREDVQFAPYAYCGPARLSYSDDLVTWADVQLKLPTGAGAIACGCMSGGSLILGHEGLGKSAVPVTVVPDIG